MSQTSQPMKSLILDLVELCAQARELAESGEQSLDALAPVRASLENVRRAADSLAACWELEALSPVLPSAQREEVGMDADASDDWLFGDGEQG